MRAVGDMVAACFACDVLVGDGRALMSGMDLRGATLDHCQLRYADLSGADLSNASLRSCSLHAVNLTGAQLSGASFEDCILREATIDRAVLAKTRWEGCQLHSITGASLQTLPPAPFLDFVSPWTRPLLGRCPRLSLPLVNVCASACLCTERAALALEQRQHPKHSPPASKPADSQRRRQLLCYHQLMRD